MVDRLTRERRSALMQRVRGKNTKPEMIVRKMIWAMGYRYRLHDNRLPGSPDIVFKKRKKAIFVHGCFWHAHGCKKGLPPKSNLDFWRPKLEATKSRDRNNQKELKDKNWEVLVIWQCDLKNPEEVTSRIRNFLTK
jgi:DNA mismatch endonuclease (patch repair protein)